MFLGAILTTMLAVSVPYVSSSLTEASRSPNITRSWDLPGQSSETEDTACQAFRGDNPTGSGWLLEDCLGVWRSWVRSLSSVFVKKKEDRQFFFGISDRLRQQGTPCFVELSRTVDGIGSRTLRTLATWLFAKELGCNCLLPNGYRPTSGTGGPLYCHSSQFMKPGETRRCAAFDWIGYFNLSALLMPFPDDGDVTEAIDAQGMSTVKLATNEYLSHGGFDHPPWVHWILKPGNRGTKYYIMPHTWDAAKFEMVRDLLKQMRTGFRWQKRPRYEGGRGCGFASSGINIAIHLRLGDRDGHHNREGSKAAPGIPDNYYDMLENFMDTVSAAAVRQGESLPVFHIFSEASQRCPSVETGAFDEFLRWPVETAQIEPCLNAVTPDECWEKTHGAPTCETLHSGTFRVQDRPLHLHLGPSIENAMSCMIEADGLLMGCSTFGQVAGFYSEGIKFFSVGCEGWLTEAHYQMAPPMAIAELGSMWVPVSGSWRNPAISSESILDVALSELFDKLGRVR